MIALIAELTANVRRSHSHEWKNSEALHAQPSATIDDIKIPAKNDGSCIPLLFFSEKHVVDLVGLSRENIPALRRALRNQIRECARKDIQILRQAYFWPAR